jgi:ferrous iron transport protein B
LRVLLVGNPNVGKSVIFSRLTGIQVVVSNYPGSTVEFKQGFFKIEDAKCEIVDVPGIYSLEATNEAEGVAVRMLEKGDVVICVMDATRLERGLPLALQLLERGKPVLVALNIYDEALHRGIHLDLEALESLLGVPVVPTVAVTGEGIKELVSRIPQARVPEVPRVPAEERWQRIGEIVARVQTITHRHHSVRERLEDFSIHPVGGILVAALVVAAAFVFVRTLGEGLIGYGIEPLFEDLYKPVLLRLGDALGDGTLLHEILIGKRIDGDIDFVESFGLLSTGLFVPLGMVFPYILSFYLVLGFLEDSGYLPRLAVLVDGLMHRVGLHGYAMIPTILGIGCNVPGILATRILESRRERFIACTLISIGVPCAALHAMIFGLVGERGVAFVLIVYGTLFLVWISLGLFLNALVRGFAPELFIEIPPYRRPLPTVVLKKLWMRMKGFLKEAVPIVLLGVLLVNLLHVAGLFNTVARVCAPVVSRLLGLPQDAVVALVIGFLRKDVAVGMLVPLNLTDKQMVVGSVVLAMFFPCIATFVVMMRELGWRDMLKSVAVMVCFSVLVGTTLNGLWPS